MSAPFRIRRPPSVSATAVQQAPDEYLARLVKLIPSEVVALYLAGKQLATTWLGVWAVVCFVLVLVARTIGTKEAGKPVQVIAVVASAVSFVVWVYATGGWFFEWQLPEAGIASVAVLIWTFLVPYLYKGD